MLKAPDVAQRILKDPLEGALKWNGVEQECFLPLLREVIV